MGQGMALMRKALVATIGLALMTLAGCGDLQDSRTLLRDVVMGGGDRAQPTPMPRVTQAMLAQQKTPLISAHVERTEGNALLALAGRNAGVDTYVSGDGSTLAFRDGVLVATRGLAGADLMSAEVPSRTVISAGTGQHQRRMFYIDGDNQPYARSFLCDLSNIGQENLVVAERSFATRHVIERCRSEDISVENAYWIDDSGVIRGSRQWVSPYLGWVELRQLKD
ncbi:hypothetical protein CDV52_05150 [Haematobacter missouriensis]|uniref:YjbF family lipoprotein n=2 Tax=Haematobacter missouriensis TaxID=366616 RepID=A0A212AV07_9RHOB|nr:hypothetical protein CDV53_11955 [Haematobacter missouriensis]OWJ85317.1 hypothetical protein CDV52_05150 [Haematobacter missouriensis]